MEILERDQFIIRYNSECDKDTDIVMDMDMNPLFYVKKEQSWKQVAVRDQLKTTDWQFEGADGASLGGVDETTQGMRQARKWQIYNSAGEYLGAGMEKFKFIGSDCVLEDAEGREIAKSKGNRKKYDYQVISSDKQVIATCQPGQQGACIVNIQDKSINTLLILGYTLVLSAFSSGRRLRRRSDHIPH